MAEAMNNDQTVVGEMHEHVDRRVIDAMRTARVAAKSTLILSTPEQDEEFAKHSVNASEIRWGIR